MKWFIFEYKEYEKYDKKQDDDIESIQIAAYKNAF